MELNKFFIVFLLLGCGPNVWTAEPDCVTECGVKFKKVEIDSWSCNKLQDVESDTMSIFTSGLVTDSRFVNSCMLVNGYSLALLDDEDVFNDKAGFTDCNTGYVWVDPHQLRASLFTHEMAHVIQRCNANSTKDDHGNWFTDKIFNAIDVIEAKYGTN